MSELLIRLTGAVEQSNFDDYRRELIAQIKAVDTALASDDDFVRAGDQVKQFKAAEKALKQAKESALEQASEINQLFDAIDEISRETRDVRLTLERQIRDRKQQIRDEWISSGQAQVRELIQAQGDDFALIGHQPFLDRGIFEAAVSRKSSTSGVQAGIEDAVATIAAQIESKAGQVKANAQTLDTLADAYQVLFQDRGSLLNKPADELDAVIDERKAALDLQIEQAARAKAQAAAAETERKGASVEHQAIAPDPVDESIADDSTPVHPQPGPGEKAQFYRLNIELEATKSEARALADEISKRYDKHPLVTSVELVSLVK